MTNFQFAWPKGDHLEKQNVLLNAFLIGVWFWLYYPLVEYFQIIFTREDFRTNQIIFVGLLILVGQRIYHSQTAVSLDALPKLRPFPLSLIIGASISYLLIERFLNINTLSATLFGLGTYGLIGLWLEPEKWRKGVPVALLFIATLPFGEHMQTFIGYPMRILTAQIVQKGLLAAGVASVGIDTILVFENGVSHIDLPCSGVRSLWTGGVFLLAATWLENRRMNAWWWATAVLFVVALFLANLSRVGLLIITGEVMGWRFLAEMIHVPLGILGFVVACSLAIGLLRLQNKFQTQSDTSQKSQTVAQSRADVLSKKQLMILIGMLAFFALIYTPRPQTGLTHHTESWQFTEGLEIENLPLTAVENEWLTKDGAESAERYRFRMGDLSGSMILISSKTWRAHHRPERCFEVYGLTLNDSSTHLVSHSQPIRMVSLGNGPKQDLYTASYWFQSDTQTTDDYGTRIWSDLALERDRWVLVSIVFDATVDPNSDEVTAFYETMHATVDNYLQ
ncbi:MAG: exosortase O [Chloroflexota bacterium]